MNREPRARDRGRSGAPLPPAGRAAFGRFATLAALAIAAFGAGGGCAKGTYLEIDFKGAGLPPVRQINLTITRNSDSYYSAGVLPDGVDAASTETVKFPASVAFQLNDLAAGTPLTVSADAISPSNAPVAHAQTTTTVMHAKTWKVTLDFAQGLISPVPDGGMPMDSEPPTDLPVTDDGGPADATDDGRSMVRLTDGNIEAPTGCIAATIDASETVSVDYESSGPTIDPGNFLSATLGPQDHFIGWMKFGLHFISIIPGPNFRITKATLNLTVSAAASTLPPQLLIRSSVNDGWTRKTGANGIAIGDKMSELMTVPAPAPMAIVSFPLDVSKHSWASEIVDGTITLGVENMTPLTGAVTTSNVEFIGVPNVGPAGAGHPTLDIEFCR